MSFMIFNEAISTHFLGGTFMIKDELLLYLYKNIGLYWEKELSLDENRHRLIYTSNPNLRRFIKTESNIRYEVKTIAQIAEQELELELNFFYMTTTKHGTRVGSLIQHLRNSIMHGNYKVNYDKNPIEIEFTDKNKSGDITMKGLITLDKLKALIECTRETN